ncbi:S1 family peptidase [Amycolatopsis rubida]|uniref:S1 family peptidase n=1 Tax=Amycolatopsis rubida TaxID=112413 RepID=A0ABX0C399_9PSEU|nr:MULTISPECIES: S1 family peptidase [Amycolatopsis]MYW97161.1 trypsin-like serine protease [Amycolatopsis rubida]NEC62146.1 S1 family peptidase [Amycolatopsis rubida]OAP24594.1 Alpha-lytic protease precursor [Amycolatopsis sp. M39]
MKAIRFLGAATAAAAVTAIFAGVPAAGAAPLNPDLVPAMQRDLGLTHSQALTRLANEEAANKVGAALEKSLGERFSGTSFNASTGKAVVSVTDAALVDQVRAAGAEAHVVQFSARQLDSTVQALNAHEKAAPKPVTGWGIDTTSNRISLTVLKGQRGAAEQFVRQSGVDSAAVTVTETSAVPKAHYNVLGGDAYYIGSSSRCSVGFSVNGGFLTAGHCAALTGGGALSGYNRVAMGQFTTYRFPGADYAAARVNSNWTPVGQINNGTRVAGSTEAAVGASVCKSGSTTGWTCGTIRAKNQTVRYQEGTVTGMVLTNARSDHGDSGGSFISGNQAQGVVSGGDTVNSYYYPVNVALSATGTTLVRG